LVRTSFRTKIKRCKLNDQYHSPKIVTSISSNQDRSEGASVPLPVVEIVPVRVVEIVPARLPPRGSTEPDLVVDIVPALVVEMVPAFVVEMVPVFAAVGVDTARTNIAVKAMNLIFVIALAPPAYWWVMGSCVRPLTFTSITASNSEFSKIVPSTPVCLWLRKLL
jgi:hypothetical protein